MCERLRAANAVPPTAPALLPTVDLLSCLLGMESVEADAAMGDFSRILFMADDVVALVDIGDELVPLDLY